MLDPKAVIPGADPLLARFPLLIPALTRWYRQSYRRLPWRESRDPYAIWISEVMLQQTQVASVQPYFERFMKRFPTLQDLAEADFDDVLRLWQGLGYYRRARLLMEAAKQLVELREWPRSPEALARLPGVGRSTAGAIASFAWGLKTPLLDGNVRRVWFRLGALTPSTPSEGEKTLWSLSETAVRHRNAATVTQALMALGATVCRPRKPDCVACPLARHCAAYASNSQVSFPPSPSHATKRVLNVSVALLFEKDRFLVTQRPEKGFLGGLWELPGGKWESGEDGVLALHRELREELGIRVIIKRDYPAVRHSYTHFGVRLHPFLCELAGKRRPESPLSIRWIRREEIAALAFPTGTLKVFDLIWAGESGRRAAESPGTWDDLALPHP
jgi:A/G-specific adenine glycosylase